MSCVMCAPAGYPYLLTSRCSQQTPACRVAFVIDEKAQDVCLGFAPARWAQRWPNGVCIPRGLCPTTGEPEASAPAKEPVAGGSDGGA